MVLFRTKITEAQSAQEFLDFLREGIVSEINEFPMDAYTRKALKADLDVLNKRYRTKLKVADYRKALCRSLVVYAKLGILTVKISEKSEYYKVLKSIELGSYLVRRIPILGRILAMMNPFIRRMYTDYEMVVAKLNYYRETESMRYRILTKNSLFQIHKKLSNRVKLARR